MFIFRNERKNVKRKKINKILLYEKDLFFLHDIEQNLMSYYIL